MSELDTKQKLLAEGTKIDRYTIHDLIGEGGMGQVYSATEAGLERKVAIKVISPQMMKVKEALIRFRNEGKALASVNHKNVVAIYSVGEHKKVPYMAIEYVDGISLHELISTHVLEPNEAVPFMRQILEGVAALHANNILHRDIKPKNILIDSYNTVKLIDFGIVKLVGDVEADVTAMDSVVGSIQYLSPEQTKGDKASVQSDIWATGITFYQMFTGFPPFAGRNALHLIENIRTKAFDFPKEVKQYIPDELIKIMTKMCAKKKGDRYANIDDIIKDLDKYMKSAKVSKEASGNYQARSIENEAQLRTYIKAQNFGEDDVQKIINLASKYQHIIDAGEDKTVGVNTDSIRVSLPAVKKAIEKVHATAKNKPQYEVTQSGLNWLGVGASAFILTAFILIIVLFNNYQKDIYNSIATEDVHLAGVKNRYLNLQEMGAAFLKCEATVKSRENNSIVINDANIYTISMSAESDCHVGNSLLRMPSQATDAEQRQAAKVMREHMSLLDRTCKILKNGYYSDPLKAFFDDPKHTDLKAKADHFILSLSGARPATARVRSDFKAVYLDLAGIDYEFKFTSTNKKMSLQKAEFASVDGSLEVRGLEYTMVMQTPLVSRAFTNSDFHGERKIASTIEFTNCRLDSE